MIKHFRFLLFILLLVAFMLAAEERETILAQYVREGLENNLALKQREFSLAASLEALREARGAFLPSVSIEARYSRAGGGRIIDMPIGDMVNPVHLTLNKLLIAHGMAPAFPANIPNQHIPFLRETDQETKIRLIQPLFQPALWINLNIQKSLSEAEKEGAAIFRRQLTLDIRTAYYNYLKLVAIRNLLHETETLLNENLAFNESLVRNDKQTEETVFRARAEISKHRQKQAETDRDLRLAVSWFNFLLNREPNAEILAPASEEPLVFREVNPESLLRQGLEHRREFRRLNAAIAVSGQTVSLYKAASLPTVSAVVDYGFQGESYRFTGADDYWMASVVLSWNLFRGGRDKALQTRAGLERKRLETQRDELERQIRLQVEEALYSLEAAEKASIACRDALAACEQAFRIVSRKYREGMVPQIEYLKARNDFTGAAAAHIIASCDYHIAGARLDNAAAVDPEGH